MLDYISSKASFYQQFSLMQSNQLAKLALTNSFLTSEEEKIELTNTNRVGRSQLAQLAYSLLGVQQTIFRFLLEENAHLGQQLHRYLFSLCLTLLNLFLIIRALTIVAIVENLLKLLITNEAILINIYCVKVFHVFIIILIDHAEILQDQKTQLTCQRSLLPILNSLLLRLGWSNSPKNCLASRNLSSRNWPSSSYQSSCIIISVRI